MATKFNSSSTAQAQNQLVKWINEAGLSEGGKRADLLRKCIEILLHQGSQSIPLFLDSILSYVSDKTTDVKKHVLTFIEEISKLHPQYLPKVIGQLHLLLLDTVIAVQKRVIQAASIVYRNSLTWICKGESTVAEMKLVWEHISELKLLILNLIDNDNEGIRTHSIKFLEEVVLLQTPCEKPEEFSLDNLPEEIPFINRNALEEEAEHIFKLLLKFHNSQHISSVNLMACMTTLCLLAKFRTKYMFHVIQALGDLHTTLPPTLSQSQVNSVRKQLKMQLISLIKHPSSNDTIPQLTQLLTDIGMTNQEIHKILPKDKRNKRLTEIKQADIPIKRLRIDSPQSNSQGSDSRSSKDFNIFDEDSNSQPSITKPTSEESILEGLNNVDNVVNLVTHTLSNHLPFEMPTTFTTTYKPIPNAGTKIQKKLLAKMLIEYIKEEPKIPAPVPVPQPALSDIAAKIPLLRDDDEKEIHEKVSLKNAVAKLQISSKPERKLDSAVAKLMEETRQDYLKEEERRAKEREVEKEEAEKLITPPTPSVPKLKQKVKLLKLQEITRPIPKEIKEKMILQAVARILRAEKESVIGGVAHIRAKFITMFASSYTPEIRDLVLDYILEDPASRIDLALSWLYEEYAFMQGFNRHPTTLQPKLHEKHDQNYNQLLCALVTQIYERGDPVMEGCRDVLLRKVYSEAPVISEEAVDYLKHLASEEKVAFLALELLEDLCLVRQPRAHKIVPAVISNVLNENAEVRETALKSTINLYTKCNESVRRVIEKHASLYLGFISLSVPPVELGGRHPRRIWSDDLYKMCLNLAMALFPHNEEIILDIGRVYGSAEAEAKRCVLRAIEGPIRALVDLGPTNEGDGLRPAFQVLLDQCPRGAETLLTRLLHIFTEKWPPTPELVSRVRELYATRVSDVRFLIPVLSGLSKKEVLAALPKFIKLNPMVVKEVFNKLIGVPGQESSPVTSEELLVELHLMDPSKADLKYIIKATALCFADKETYNEEVISGVLQRLAEEPEIPVLMMRSVLQAVTLFPNLFPLVFNILQLLIEKEVWTNKIAWEGWIKCCELLLPSSSFLLNALPSRAMNNLANAAPPSIIKVMKQDPQLSSFVPQSHSNAHEPLPPGIQ